MLGHRPQEWYVISLRPRGGHGAVRRAAANHGAGVVALSPWTLQARDGVAVRESLAAALAAPRVLFTSPAAVRAADALQPLARVRGRAWFAVGAGSAAALHRVGVTGVAAPARMDSEGLLGLAGLQDVAGTAVGVVTAPGGRGAIEAALRARGAQVARADVYARVPVSPSARAMATLGSLRAPAVLLLSSAGALEQVARHLPSAAWARLRGCGVAAASERLAEVARAQGFAEVARAEGPRPGQLVAAAARLVPIACAR